jgi:hypothetical protein
MNYVIDVDSLHAERNKVVAYIDKGYKTILVAYGGCVCEGL